MSDIVCVTDSRECEGDFLERLESIASASPRAIILREKQLGEGEYAALAKEATGICSRYGTQLILHSFTKVALDLGANALHLPLSVLLSTPREMLSSFGVLGASCHSAADIEKAENLGCTYVTLGNIFATDCKPGLKGKGLEFLQSCCRSARIPVWAIGGITPQNIRAVRQAGAECACIRGAFMKCGDAKALLSSFARGV